MQISSMSPLVTFGPNFEKPAKCRREEERRRWLGGAGAACTVPWFQSSSLHRLSGACVVWIFFTFLCNQGCVQCSCSFSNPQYNGNSHKFILIKKNFIYFFYNLTLLHSNDNSFCSNTLWSLSCFRFLIFFWPIQMMLPVIYKQFASLFFPLFFIRKIYSCKYCCDMILPITASSIMNINKMFCFLIF